MSDRSLTPTGDFHRPAGIREFAGTIFAIAAAVLAILLLIALGAGIAEAAWVTTGLVVGLIVATVVCGVAAGLLGIRTNLMIRDHQEGKK